MNGLSINNLRCNKAQEVIENTDFIFEVSKSSIIVANVFDFQDFSEWDQNYF